VEVAGVETHAVQVLTVEATQRLEPATVEQSIEVAAAALVVLWVVQAVRVSLFFG